MDISSELSDEALVKKIQEGDNDLFSQIIVRYESKLRRYASRFLLRDEADDMMQEVFIKAFQNIQSFDTERKFNSWIYRIAHNEFVNEIRKKSRFNFNILEFDTVFPHPVAKETAEKEAISNEAKQQVEAALDKINSKYREILILYYLEELNYQEISDILKIPLSTVGVRLLRAKEAIKKHLSL